ncbi:MAG: Ribonuclease [Thermoleophilia bacterium]|nr:Ribonuclease [Thermoleophilia bacterium]
MTEVEIHTDGSCSGNPGPGGWSCILRSGVHAKELSGWELSTTNNRMELTAVIEGLRALKRRSRVTVCSDSAYVLNPFVKGWLAKWQANGWRTGKEPIKNQDLWVEAARAVGEHDVNFRKVKGHSGDPLNERADELAVAATQQAIAALRSGATV